MVRGCQWWWSTAPRAGAIAVAHLRGEAQDVDRVLAALTGAPAPGVGAVVWRRFGAVDDGVVARLDPSHALVMPHGGVRIRALLDERMRALGAATGEADASAPFPEARDAFEAAMLATLARAASPMAVDLLAAQPARWRAAGAHDAAGARDSAVAAASLMAHADARDLRLRRLITPPRVVVTGPANAGKSTLLNLLAGRTVALAHDVPGTTRDAVAARIDLAGLVVDWFDTPGVRDHADAIERAAAQLALRALRSADLVIHLTAPGMGWHALDANTAAAPLRVMNKCDTAAAARCDEARNAALHISAATGAGIETLVARVRDALVPPADIASAHPWRFADGLPGA